MQLGPSSGRTRAELPRRYPTIEDASEKMQEENSRHLWPISAASDAADVIRFSESHSHA